MPSVGTCVRAVVVVHRNVKCSCQSYAIIGNRVHYVMYGWPLMMSMMAVDSLRNLHINSWRVKNKNGKSVANEAKQGHHRHQHSLIIKVGFKVGGKFYNEVNLTPRVLGGQFDTKSVKESIWHRSQFDTKSVKESIWHRHQFDTGPIWIYPIHISKMYMPHQPCARRAHRHPQTKQHPTIVGRIYPIQIHISENVHFPTMCPKGTQTPPNWTTLYNCWKNVSNTNCNTINIWCQIGASVKLTLLHPWCQIDPFTLLVSNWLRCQIGAGVKLSSNLGNQGRF